MPCRSFQYVHDNIIAAGGEIDVLDPAGYGAITITKALSIVNDGVGTAGVQQGTAGQNAITINAGTSDAVTLRGLNIDGLGTGQNGIVFNTGGSLTVVNCVIRHFAYDGSEHTGDSILIQPTSGSMKFVVSNTIASDNGFEGIAYYPLSGAANAQGAIDHVVAANNQYSGIDLNTSSAGGGVVSVTISNSIASNNSGSGIHTHSGSGTLTATVDSSDMNNNSFGIYAIGSAIVLLNRSVFTSNVEGVYNGTSPNRVYTYGNNLINYNTSADVEGTALNTSFKPL
ncbi:right-handed parallel beta-helix repeat-containing protein [Methylocapsa sp. S129]|uniref:right-handed parallel beta-helix repeat-containing protein n=1 Tax=Methylocapsa sp. S129 TaxID=1641869 RepID=UPI00131D21C4|nr:right-handed parallel beta-helix repeat-containing protein [Methylocapsa sp. S129]